MDFKIKTGLAFVICHFILMIFLFVCLMLGGYKFEEFTTLVGFLIPMLAGYTTAIVKDISRNVHSRKKLVKTYTPEYRFLVKFTCSIFFLSLFTVIGLRGFNYAFENFEQLKITVGLLEAVFGSYIAQLIFAVYKKDKDDIAELEPHAPGATQ